MSPYVRRIFLASVAGGFVLFLFDGAFQAIPHFGIRAVERMGNDTLTLSGVNGLTDGMAYVVTGKTVSFVATRPADYYDPVRFFSIEMVSAFIIATILALIFSRNHGITLRQRMLYTLGFSVMACFAIHVPYLNWWGFSVPYTLGVVSKTILGWLLVAYVQNRFIYKTR
jgi:hypothetical protein